MTPTFRIKINGKDKTKALRGALQSLTFKDADGTQSDELTLQLVGNFPRPVYQDEIELSLGYEGKASAGHPPMFCGLFKVQTSKRTPHQLTVTATGADFAGRLKEKRNQSYTHIRLSELAHEIASRHDLQAKSDATDILLEHLSQTDESDLHLLKRLAKEHHCLFSIKNQTLLFVKKSEATQKNGQLPHFQIAYDQFTALAITHSNKTCYAACQLTYHDSKTNARFQATAGQGEPIHQVKKRCTSQAEAQQKANAALEQVNEGTKRGNFEIQGQELYAGGILKITGTPNGVNDGDYTIQSLTHELSPSTGWKIRGEFQN